MAGPSPDAVAGCVASSLAVPPPVRPRGNGLELVASATAGRRWHSAVRLRRQLFGGCVELGAWTGWQQPALLRRREPGAPLPRGRVVLGISGASATGVGAS